MPQFDKFRAFDFKILMPFNQNLSISKGTFTRTCKITRKEYILRLCTDVQGYTIKSSAAKVSGLCFLSEIENIW